MSTSAIKILKYMSKKLKWNFFITKSQGLRNLKKKSKKLPYKQPISLSLSLSLSGDFLDMEWYNGVLDLGYFWIFIKNVLNFHLNLAFFLN